MQQVVKALGDLKEPLVTADHDPTDVDARSGEIAEEDLQHLGHAAALLGRVEVPQPSTIQPIGGLL
jgi:hypothetical protein